MALHRSSDPSMLARLFGAALLLFFTWCTPAIATIDPVGDEAELSDPGSGVISSAVTNPNRSVDLAADGSFVIVWTDFDDGTFFGESIGVSARRFAADGTPVSGNLRVNSYTTGVQQLPSVASRPDGSFIVTWEDQSDIGAVRGEIRARLFDANGAAITGELAVNATTAGAQTQPAVAILSTNGFVVAWQSSSVTAVPIMARVFSENGTPAGGEFRLSEGTASLGAIVAATSDGFVAAWGTIETRGSGDGDKGGIAARSFDNLGNPRGGEFQVNTYTTERQHLPAIAVGQNDDFTVAWVSRGQDGSTDGVYAQIYGSGGSSVGGEFRVAEATLFDQRFPSVAYSGEGFVVAWTNEEQSALDNRIRARCFDGAGAALGAEFVVSSTETDNSSVAGADDGAFVFVWTGSSPGNVASRAVLGRRYMQSAAGTCGDPIGSGAALVAADAERPFAITASDALFVLKVSISAETCELCVCDVDDSGAVTATDALRLLRAAVGQSVTLICPAC